MQKFELLDYGQFYHIYNRGINRAKLFYQPRNYDYFLKLYLKYITPIAETYAYCLMSNHFHLLVRIKDADLANPANPDRISGNSQPDGNNKIIFAPTVVSQGNPVRISGNSQPDGNNKIIFAPSVISQGNPDRISGNSQPDGNNKIIYAPSVISQGNPDRISGDKKLHLYFSHLFNAYSKAINKQENRTGSLFQRPFKRIKINNENYIRQLIIYIHNNPVKHGFTKSPEEWAHSSYNKIIYKNSRIVCCQDVINIFGDISNFKITHKNRLSLYAEEDLED